MRSNHLFLHVKILYSFSVRRRTNGKSTKGRFQRRERKNCGHLLCICIPRSPAPAPMTRTRIAWHGGVAYAMPMRCINGSRPAPLGAGELRKRQYWILRRAPSRSTMHFDKAFANFRSFNSYQRSPDYRLWLLRISINY